MKTEEEIGMMQPQVKECQELPEAEEARESLLPGPLEGV